MAEQAVGIGSAGGMGENIGGEIADGEIDVGAEVKTGGSIERLITNGLLRNACARA